MTNNAFYKLVTGIFLLILILVSTSCTRRDFKMSLKDKNLSIVGDSISTYIGYSNDAVNTNSNIHSNIIFYDGIIGGIKDVNQTWWMKVANDTGMNVLVNNSSGGLAAVSVEAAEGYVTRLQNLHDDTGSNSGTNPDIIAVYIGTNDYTANVEIGNYSDHLGEKLITKIGDNSYVYETPTNFAEAYFMMIDKIVNNYQSSDVYCFTILPNTIRNELDELEEYNAIIKKIAEYYNVNVVDLYNDSGITLDNCLEHSNDGVGVHPNELGMTAIAETFKKTLLNKYSLD